MISDTMALLAATDMVQTMLGKKCTQQLYNIPLSHITVTQWIADISEDLEEQLTGKLRHKRLSIQFDKATHCSGIVHLTGYMRYVEDTTINKDVFFFFKSIKRRATAKELFKIVDDFMEGRKKWIKSSACVGVCIDIARVMARNKGQKALIK
jgi:hypothetical protein